MAPVKSDPQGIGSMITYCRRYSLNSMLGIASEDDDGEASMGRDTPAEVHQPKAEAPTKPAPKGKVGMLEDQAKALCSMKKIDFLSEIKAFAAVNPQLLTRETQLTEFIKEYQSYKAVA